MERKRTTTEARSAVPRKTRRSLRQAAAGELRQEEDEVDEPTELVKKESGEKTVLPVKVENLTYETFRDEYWANVKLPSTLWAFHRDPKGKYIAFSHMATNTSSTFMSTDKAVLFDGTLETETFVRGKKVTPPNFIKNVRTIEDINSLLNQVESLILCNGTGLDVARYSPNCFLFLLKKYRNSRCYNCSLKRTHLKKTEAQRVRRAAAKQKELGDNRISTQRQSKVKKQERKSSVKISHSEDFAGQSDDREEDEDEGEEEEEEIKDYDDPEND